jgi:Bacillus/Clostridium GerA spore germination protein.
MIGNLKRIYRAFRVKAANGNMNQEPQQEKAPVPDSVSAVRTELEKAFGNSTDVIFKLFSNTSLLLVYIDGMVDKLLLDSDIIRPLMRACQENKNADFKNPGFLEDNILAIGEVVRSDDFNDCINAILQGQVLIFPNGCTSALKLNLQKWNKRNVEQPQAENVVRGPREGFTESIRDNVVLIRRKIQDCNLVIETMYIGRQTKTKVSFCYIRGVANEEIVEEVRKRLRNIHTDIILESGYLEEFIDDAPFSIFPTVGYTERPDAAAGKLLEGRIAILCDGTPMALTVPNLFVEYLQSSEDYYMRWLYTPLLRLIRLIALFVSTMTPAFYVTLLCFHQDVIPFKLLLTIAASSEGTPLPPVLECLVLIVIFELIREGGVRMPKSLGQAISIVGALILGQAAVQAGIVSAPAIIVIAATAITSFVLPKLDDTMLIIRIVLLFTANIIGFLGIVLASFMFFIYLCSLKSFGIPYLSPIAPRSKEDLKDTFIRMPVWSMLRKSETVTRQYIGSERRDEK